MKLPPLPKLPHWPVRVKKTGQASEGQEAPEPAVSIIAPATFHTVGSRTYAFGLLWLSPGGGDKLSHAGLRDAKRFGGTHLAYRPKQHQYGVARVSGDEGANRKTRGKRYSAAATLADALPSSWVAAYALGDGRAYIVASVNGKIHPDGDVMFDDVEEAQAHFLQLVKAGEWRHIYAPRDWHIQNASPHDILEVLRGKPTTALAPAKNPALAKIETLPPWAVMAVVAIVASGGFIVIFKHHHRPAVQRATIHHRTQRIKTLYPRIRPATVIALRCGAYAPTMLYGVFIPGWTARMAVCNGQGITITEERGPGVPYSTIEAFAPQANRLSAGKRAEIDYPFADPPRPAALNLPLPSQDYFRSELELIAERALGSAVVISEPVPPGVHQPFLRLDWTLTANAPAAVWSAMLGRLPDIAIDVESLTPSKSHIEWTLKGRAYAAP